MGKNRIWIELVHPKEHEFYGVDDAATKEFADKQCELATRMLGKLGDLQGSHFFWSSHERMYCFGGPMGYETLSDNGKWFNLDYLGRES